MIAAIRDEEKVVPYLDLPIQHASDTILKRMGRRTSNEDLRRIIGKLRAEIPNIALRTSLITGFPGETEEDHEELYRFVNEMEFDRLGVFTYSREENTPAAVMPNQIDEEVKEARRDEIMELQQAIAFEKAEDMVGQVLWCMIEGKVADEDVYIGRTYKDAPNVDGYIFVQTSATLMTGDFVKVQVTDSNEYDIYLGIDLFDFQTFGARRRVFALSCDGIWVCRNHVEQVEYVKLSACSYTICMVNHSTLQLQLETPTL